MNSYCTGPVTALMRTVMRSMVRAPSPPQFSDACILLDEYASEGGFILPVTLVPGTGPRVGRPTHVRTADRILSISRASAYLRPMAPSARDRLNVTTPSDPAGRRR